VKNPTPQAGCLLVFGHPDGKKYFENQGFIYSVALDVHATPKKTLQLTELFSPLQRPRAPTWAGAKSE
jgi:hypothetical protein